VTTSGAGKHGLALRATTFDVDERGVAVLTLNRPDAGNARNQQMRHELTQVYEVVAADDAIRVLVLTGAGDRAFCAGMDLKEAGGPETNEERRQRLRSSRDIEQLAQLPKPTIAAINGYALGGGCEMALACDLRVMADEARLALPELTHGLVPGGGATQRLPRLVGIACAFEMIYLGTALYGPAAVARGLATASVPRADLATLVAELSGRLATFAPAAVRAAKSLISSSHDTPLQLGLDQELDRLLDLLQDRAADAG
jgi:enoyl-CoA hydratase/carnithine racemase